MTSTHVVMFISGEPTHRKLYVDALQRLNVLPVWVDTVRDAPRLLAQFRVAAIVVHVSAADEVSQSAKFVSALSPSPVILLGSPGWRSSTHIELAFEAGCAAVVTEPCTPSIIAAVVKRSIAGERRIQWPNPLCVDAS
jgi:hypothetical protein